MGCGRLLQTSWYQNPLVLHTSTNVLSPCSCKPPTRQLLLSVLQLFISIWMENCYTIKGKAWEAEPWECTVMYINMQLYNIQKSKTIASGPITSWEIDGETMETVTNFIFLGFKVIADSDWSHEINRCLLLGRKVMINLDSILKSRDINLLTKVHKSKLWFFQ